MASSSELFLGFADAGDNGLFQDSVTAQIEKQAVTIVPDANPRRIVSVVIPSELDNYLLTLTWGARLLQPIIRERRQRFDLAVELAFRTTTGLVKAALHRPAAAAILLQVRSGEADIMSVDIPRGIVGTLNIREGTLGWNEIVRFGKGARHASLNDEQLSILTSWLRKRGVDVWLSFGSFGEFTVSAEGVKRTQGALSKSLRERLEWYLRLTGEGPALYELDSLSDWEIVKAVSAQNKNPSAVARQNCLLNELKIEMGGSREQ